MTRSARSSSPTPAAGFTLIELLVVVAIMGIMSAIVVFNNSALNEQLVLKKAADEIALLYRQAQIEGLAVYEDPDNFGEYAVGYGVYVNIGNPSGSPSGSPSGNTETESNTSLIYFTDRPDGSNLSDGAYNGNFDCAGSPECQDVVELDRVIISSVSAGGCPANTGISSVYRRPRPEILISNDTNSNTCEDITLTLEAPSGGEATVNIRSASEITVTYDL
ncbi:MAG: prepilin-type N-terminal cleavage/methylation domain-containing protein [Candidatus Paceibacterota bacterium]